jgi:SAM-dependent methyltransferase
VARYAYDQAWEQERARLAGIEAMWESGSRALLEAVGVGDAWHCLEVGAGGGALVEWLAERVGARGAVLATDLDPRFVEPLAGATVEVRRHDITTGPPETGAFDLVHARLVVEHLPDPRAAIANMAASLRPGGWLVVEDYDWTAFGGDPPDALTERVGAGVLAFMAKGGFNPVYGRRVVSDVAAAGLEDVRGEGRQLIVDATHPGFAFFRLSFEALRGGATGAGVIDPADADAFAARLAEGGLRVITPVVVTAVGRRPA